MTPKYKVGDEVVHRTGAIMKVIGYNSDMGDYIYRVEVIHAKSTVYRIGYELNSSNKFLIRKFTKLDKVLR